MTPSSDSCETRDPAWPTLELNLPEGEGLLSLPRRLPLERMVYLNRQLCRWFPANAPSEEERWRAKNPEEFRL